LLKQLALFRHIHLAICPLLEYGTVRPSMAAMMDDKVKYLLSLEAIRGRASIVYKAAQEGKLSNFDFHPEHMEDAAAYVAALIDVCANCSTHWPNLS
jgi:hypothetical protein